MDDDVMWGPPVHVQLDVEEPTGWVRLVGTVMDGVRAGVAERVVVCINVIAQAEGPGELLQLAAEEEADFKRRVVESYNRRRGRGIYKG